MSEATEHYTPIPNDLLTALMRARLWGDEWQIMMVIIRFTIGFHRTWMTMTLIEFEQHTGICRNHVCRTLRKLQNRNIIMKRCNGSKNKSYGVRRDPTQWDVVQVKRQRRGKKDCESNVDNSSTITIGCNNRVTIGDNNVGIGGNQLLPAMVIGGDLTPLESTGSDSLKKPLNKVLKKAGKQRKSAIVSNSVSALLKGNEKLITDADPSALVELFEDAGYEIGRTWAAIVQARTKDSPPAYFVHLMESAKYPPADYATDQARKEMRETEFMTKGMTEIKVGINLDE